MALAGDTAERDAAGMMPVDVAPAAAERTAAKPTRRSRQNVTDLSVREETSIDFQETAILADEGFGVAPGSFCADHLRWLYDEAFSDGTIILGLYAGDRKIGHLALVRHSVALGSHIEPAVALMDLFILPAFRSRNAIAALYGHAETLCTERGIRFIIAVPNTKAGGVNRRHLKLTDIAPLDIRAGLAMPFGPRRRVISHRAVDLDPDAACAILADYCDPSERGLHWTADRLWNRLCKPSGAYTIHAGPRVLAIATSRADHRASYALICALLRRPGAIVRRSDVAAVTAAACRMHRRPLYVYCGLNDRVPRPGFRVPQKLRPSPMVLQLRDFTGTEPHAFDRFEPLDFDFG